MALPLRAGKWVLEVEPQSAESGKQRPHFCPGRRWQLSCPFLVRWPRRSQLSSQLCPASSSRRSWRGTALPGSVQQRLISALTWSRGSLPLPRPSQLPWALRPLLPGTAVSCSSRAGLAAQRLPRPGRHTALSERPPEAPKSGGCPDGELQTLSPQGSLGVPSTPATDPGVSANTEPSPTAPPPHLQVPTFPALQWKAGREGGPLASGQKGVCVCGRRARQPGEPEGNPLLHRKRRADRDVRDRALRVGAPAPRPDAPRASYRPSAWRGGTGRPRWAPARSPRSLATCGGGSARGVAPISGRGHAWAAPGRGGGGA